VPGSGDQVGEEGEVLEAAETGGMVSMEVRESCARGPFLAGRMGRWTGTGGSGFDVRHQTMAVRIAHPVSCPS